MSLVAPVKNGEIQSVTQSTSKEEVKSGGSLDKDAFLQLLVAQMKYQDPLEPTSNTEYISQLATFSSLEEMQNMRGSLELQRASAMVGQEVYIKTTDKATGSTDFVHGKVDYVQYENGKAFLSVNGSLYSIDELDSVYDGEYTEAYNAAYDWTVGLNKLPALDKLTLDDDDSVLKLKELLEEMTDYQKTFLTAENKDKLEAYLEKLELLEKAKEALEKAEEEAGKDAAEEVPATKEETTEKTENAEGTTESEKTENAEEVTEPESTEGESVDETAE